MKYSSSSSFFLVLLRAPLCGVYRVTIEADEALEGKGGRIKMALPVVPPRRRRRAIFRNGIGNTHCTVKCESLSVEFWIRFCVMPDSINDEIGL